MSNPVSGVTSASRSRTATAGECDGTCTFMWVLYDPEGQVENGYWAYMNDCPFEYCNYSCNDCSTPGSYAGELQPGTCS